MMVESVYITFDW